MVGFLNWIQFLRVVIVSKMNELIPFGIAAVSKALDDLTTNLYCDRFGTNNERILLTRLLMNKFGIWKSSPIRQLLGQGYTLGIGGALYVFDKYANIENEHINFHKAWLYAFSSINTYLTLNNTLKYVARKYFIKEKNDTI